VGTLNDWFGIDTKGLTEATFDKWIKPEHKDALEALAGTLVTMGAIPGLNISGLVGNLSTTLNIPPAAITGALSDPKNPLNGFIMGGMGQYGGDVGKLLNTPMGEAAVRYATGDQAGALTAALGAVPLVGDYFKSGDGKKLLSSILPSISGGGDLGGALGQLLKLVPGDIGEIFGNNAWLGNVVEGLFGGDFVGALNAPNIDFGGLGDFGDLLNKILPESGQIKDFMNDYGIPIGLGYLGKEEAKKWVNKTEDSIRNQEVLGDQYMKPYNQMFSKQSGQSPFELAGYAPNTGQSMTGDFVNKMVGELTAKAGGTPGATQGAQGAQNPAYDVTDVLKLKKAMGTSQGDPNYNPAADLDKNGMVDVGDFLVLKKNFGGGAGAVGAEGGPATMQAAGKQYAGGTQGFSETGAGAADGGGQGTTIGPNGAPIMKLKKDMTPFELAISAEMDRAINGMNTDSARLQRNYMMENVDKDYLKSARALDEASTGRGMMPGASSGTRIRNLQDLLGQRTGAQQNIDRDLFIKGEDEKKSAQQNLLNTAMSMMGMPLSAAGNQASIGGQSGQMAKDIYDQYGQLAQAIAYGQANKQNEQNPINLTNVWGQQTGTTQPPLQQPTAGPAPVPTTGDINLPGGYPGGTPGDYQPVPVDTGVENGPAPPPTTPTNPWGTWNGMPVPGGQGPGYPPATSQTDIPIPSLESPAPAPQQTGPYGIQGEPGTGAGYPPQQSNPPTGGGYQQSEFMRQAPRTSMGGAQGIMADPNEPAIYRTPEQQQQDFDKLNQWLGLPQQNVSVVQQNMNTGMQDIINQAKSGQQPQPPPTTQMGQQQPQPVAMGQIPQPQQPAAPAPNKFANMQQWYDQLPAYNNYKPSMNMLNNFQDGQGTNSTNMKLDTYNNRINQFGQQMPSYLKEQADMLRNPVATTSTSQAPNLASMLSSRTKPKMNYQQPQTYNKGRFGLLGGTTKYF
jgi:hypothetical protein